jgi:ankyrin repeat protein
MLHPVPEIVRAITSVPNFDPRSGQAALVSAVEAGQTAIVEMLVEAGVDVNCNTGGITPLVAAIEARNVALMTYLENHGARENP